MKKIMMLMLVVVAIVGLMGSIPSEAGKDDYLTAHIIPTERMVFEVGEDLGIYDCAFFDCTLWDALQKGDEIIVVGITAGDVVRTNWRGWMVVAIENRLLYVPDKDLKYVGLKNDD